MSGPEGTAAQRWKLSNLQLRILSGLVLGFVAIGATWAGGAWFQLFAVVIGVAIFVEWCLITRASSDARHQALSAVLLAAVFVAACAGWAPPLEAFALGAVLCALAGFLFGRWRWTLAGFCYAGLSGLSLEMVRGGQILGLLAIVLLFAVVWTTDIMAYFVGRGIGGPKLAPAISPGKTWSGALGGAAFGCAAGVAVGVFAGAAGLAGIALVSLALSAVAQAGDLFESWVKRRFGVKDSSQIIPGHGGVMDRVDGLVVAAALLCFIDILASGSSDVLPWLLPGAP